MFACRTRETISTVEMCAYRLVTLKLCVSSCYGLGRGRAGAREKPRAIPKCVLGDVVARTCDADVSFR